MAQTASRITSNNIIDELAESANRSSSSEESGDKKGRSETQKKITSPICEEIKIQEAEL